MENLEQHRAANALARATDCRKRADEGDCLSGYPSLITNNGLLACLAYSIEKSTRDGRLVPTKQWINVANAIAFHLDKMGIARRNGGQADAIWLRDYLAGRAQDNRNERIGVDSFTLRRATNEALAFLGYLKRFVKTTA